MSEIVARINNKVDGRFVVDTGNNSDCWSFTRSWKPTRASCFTEAARRSPHNRGVGGSSAAVPASVDRLQIGPFSLYNRYANICSQIVARSQMAATPETSDSDRCAISFVTFDVAKPDAVSREGALVRRRTLPSAVRAQRL